MKAQFIKPIWIITASLALVLVFGTLAIAFPLQEAEADHDRVETIIHAQKKMVTVTPYFESTICSTEFCHVHHDTLNKRDYKRFLRWCGGDEKVVEIGIGIAISSAVCDGKGPWRIFIQAAHETSGSATNNPHGFSVKVTVHAHAP